MESWWRSMYNTIQYLYTALCPPDVFLTLLSTQQSASRHCIDLSSAINRFSRPLTNTHKTDIIASGSLPCWLHFILQFVYNVLYSQLFLHSVLRLVNAYILFHTVLQYLMATLCSTILNGYTLFYNRYKLHSFIQSVTGYRLIYFYASFSPFLMRISCRKFASVNRHFLTQFPRRENLTCQLFHSKNASV